MVEPLLTFLGKLRANGELSDELFDAQIHRLSRDELGPRGFSLTTELLPDAHTSFEIRNRQGAAVAFLQC